MKLTHALGPEDQDREQLDLWNLQILGNLVNEGEVDAELLYGLNMSNLRLFDTHRAAADGKNEILASLAPSLDQHSKELFFPFSVDILPSAPSQLRRAFLRLLQNALRLALGLLLCARVVEPETADGKNEILASGIPVRHASRCLQRSSVVASALIGRGFVIEASRGDISRMVERSGLRVSLNPGVFWRWPEECIKTHRNDDDTPFSWRKRRSFRESRRPTNSQLEGSPLDPPLSDRHRGECSGRIRHAEPKVCAAAVTHVGLQKHRRHRAAPVPKPFHRRQAKFLHADRLTDLLDLVSQVPQWIFGVASLAVKAVGVDLSTMGLVAKVMPLAPMPGSLFLGQQRKVLAVLLVLFEVIPAALRLDSGDVNVRPARRFHAEGMVEEGVEVFEAVKIGLLDGRHCVSLLVPFKVFWVIDEIVLVVCEKRRRGHAVVISAVAHGAFQQVTSSDVFSSDGHWEEIEQDDD
ncbi:hypothetical protein MMC07_006242 [Pseudocyphellaria aurata]|nr:hypothetical protein [Pseudocyphellaria aurata]